MIKGNSVTPDKKCYVVKIIIIGNQSVGKQILLIAMLKVNLVKIIMLP